MNPSLVGLVAIAIGTLAGCGPSGQEFYLDFKNGVTARQSGSDADAKVPEIYLGDFEEGKPIPVGYLSFKAKIMPTNKVSEQDFLEAGFPALQGHNDQSGNRDARPKSMDPR